MCYGVAEKIGLEFWNAKEKCAMKQNRWLVMFLLAAALSLITSVYAKDHEDVGPYKLIATISIPGFGNGFDISWVDSEAGRYYLANRGNATAVPPVAAHIDVIDTRRLKLLDPLPVHAAGNGVVAIRKRHDDDDDEWQGEASEELWVGDARSFVEVIDLKSKSIVADIFTGGKGRADELAYDPLDRIMIVANDQEATPFVTFISTRTRTVLGKLDYPQAVFGTPPTNHGLEQPVWNPKTRKFYLSVPGTIHNPQGEVDEIDPHQMMVIRVFPAVCNPGEAPQGLALVPRQRLVTSCGDILRISDGKVLKTVPGLGIDEIWFNPGDERVYFAGGPNFIVDPSVPVLDTDTNTLVAVIKVGTPPPPLRFTHSVAADSETNRIFVPISGVGVKVYTDSDEEEGHHDR
jgi:DNA-binding beta-propeller fold protein YncE